MELRIARIRSCPGRLLRCGLLLLSAAFLTQIWAADAFAQHDRYGHEAPSSDNDWTHQFPVFTRELLENLGTVVPELRNRTRANAEAELGRAKLRLGQSHTVQAGGRPGTVVRQYPAAGERVDRGSAVQIWLVAEPTGTRVPDVLGQEERRAVRTLNAAGLSYKSTIEQPSNASRGTVLHQEPQPGTIVDRGTSFYLVVATPLPVTVEEVVVPDVVSMDAAIAAEVLTKSKLIVGDSRTKQSRRRARTVLVQRPAAGTRVPAGSSIDLQIAVPIPEPKPTRLTVPNLIGKSKEDAIALLKKHGLAAGEGVVVESENPANTVVTQRPAAKTRVAPGSTVDFSVATAIRVVVPNLVGRSREEAASALKDKGLRIGSTRQRESDAPEQSIVAQQPAAGTKVARDSNVSITLATPIMTTVPNVVGKDLDAARDVLGRGNLGLGSVEHRESSQTSGTVIEQRPAAGERVRTGTAVNVTQAVPMLVEVPDLTSRSRENAERALARVGLELGRVTTEPATDNVGRVIRQQPNPGARVRVGSEIGIVVARLELISVPNLVGESVQVAAQLLADRGLALTVGYETTTWKPGRNVFGQNPLPGAMVPRASAVDVTLAVGVWQSTPFVSAAGGTLGLSMLTFGLMKWRHARQPTVQEDSPSQPGSLDVHVRPTIDPGTQIVEASPDESANRARGPALRIRPRMDGGSQLLVSEAHDDSGENGNG